MNIGKRQESGVRSQKVNISSPSPHVLIFLSSQSPVTSHQSPVTCLLTRQKQQTPAIFAGVSQ
ncbi:hypothetical protein PN497_22900 [Sphaerospermopsis kisseleviana CS-549]|uniref:Uncharacterized protein n=1 Tax=Sphaerospermopsis kisseleviana CS-549 TaxID=3021783 RepID=A0ABT4ZYL0_9CYAN|nr:hypothetical protein [Sphaerospermopsis kisseleviana]MDB9444176.1 hypothetical protein [Sphaerospermopsis kisseleviana CS-549]